MKQRPDLLQLSTVGSVFFVHQYDPPQPPDSADEAGAGVGPGEEPDAALQDGAWPDDGLLDDGTPVPEPPALKPPKDALRACAYEFGTGRIVPTHYAPRSVTVVHQWDGE